MAGTNILTGMGTGRICTSPYPINIEIFRQNRDIFRQYSWKRVYLSSKEYNRI